MGTYPSSGAITATLIKPLHHSYLSSFFRIGVLLSIGLWVFGQFERIELDQGRALYGHDIVLFVLVVLIAWKWRAALLKAFSSTIGILWIAVASWILLNVLLHFGLDRSGMLTGTLYLVRLCILTGYGWALCTLLNTHRLSFHYFSRTIFAAFFAVSVLGFVQYFLFPDTRALVLMGWDDHYFRLISTLFDPGFTGIILAIAALLHIRNTFLHKTSLAEYSFILLHGIGLLLTYSRASYLAFIAGILLVALVYRWWKVLLIIPAFALCLLLLPRPGGEGVKLERTASVVARLESNTQALQTQSSLGWLIGNGWYAKKVEQPTQIKDGISVPNHSSAPENALVFIYSSLGVIGVVLVMLFIGALVLRVGITSEFSLAIGMVLVHSLFSNTLFHPFILILLAWIMARSVHDVPRQSQ